jgi:hypothetical protein
VKWRYLGLKEGTERETQKGGYIQLSSAERYPGEDLKGTQKGLKGGFPVPNMESGVFLHSHREKRVINELNHLITPFNVTVLELHLGSIWGLLVDL